MESKKPAAMRAFLWPEYTTVTHVMRCIESRWTRRILLCRRVARNPPLVGDVKILLPNEKGARKVRHLAFRRFFEHTNSMTHSFHIAALLPSPKRDAGLRACERRDALLPESGKRNYQGSTHID